MQQVEDEINLVGQMLLMMWMILYACIVGKYAGSFSLLLTSEWMGAWKMKYNARANCAAAADFQLVLIVYSICLKFNVSVCMLHCTKQCWPFVDCNRSHLSAICYLITLVESENVHRSGFSLSALDFIYLTLWKSYGYFSSRAADKSNEEEKVEMHSFTRTLHFVSAVPEGGFSEFFHRWEQHSKLV